VSDDRGLIRDLVENWAVWRDAGDWERFATVWHDDGFMMATWFQGPAAEFIRVSRLGFESGVNILHFLGGTSIDLAAKAPPLGAADSSDKAPPSGAADSSNNRRAIAQTKMTISQRAEVQDVICDVVCTGRFYDFLEKRDGAWGIVLRQPIYEKDRLDPLDPAASLTLDPNLLASFPVGYRHLAYVQSQLGFEVKRDMPGLTGPATDRLYRRGTDWLAGRELGDPLKTVG
jgi:SnoaL-like domain